MREANIGLGDPRSEAIVIAAAVNLPVVEIHRSGYSQMADESRMPEPLREVHQVFDAFTCGTNSTSNRREHKDDRGYYSRTFGRGRRK